MKETTTSIDGLVKPAYLGSAAASLLPSDISSGNFDPKSFFEGIIKNPPPMTATGVESYADSITAEDAFYYNVGEDALFIQREHSMRGRVNEGDHVVNFERHGSAVSSDYEQGGVHVSMRSIKPWSGYYAGGKEGIEFYSFDIRAKTKRASFTFQNHRFAILTDSEGNIRKYADGHIGIEDAILWIPHIAFFQNGYSSKMEIWFHGNIR